MFKRIIKWIKGEVSVDSLVSTFHKTVHQLEALAKEHEETVEMAQADIKALEHQIETVTGEIARATAIAGNLKSIVGPAA